MGLERARMPPERRMSNGTDRKGTRGDKATRIARSPASAAQGFPFASLGDGFALQLLELRAVLRSRLGTGPGSTCIFECTWLALPRIESAILRAGAAAKRAEAKGSGKTKRRERRGSSQSTVA